MGTRIRRRLTPVSSGQHPKRVESSFHSFERVTRVARRGRSGQCHRSNRAREQLVNKRVIAGVIVTALVLVAGGALVRLLLS